MSRGHDNLRKMVRSIILEDLASPRAPNIYITSTGKQFAVPTFKSDQDAETTDDSEDDAEDDGDAKAVPATQGPAVPGLKNTNLITTPPASPAAPAAQAAASSTPKPSAAPSTTKKTDAPPSTPQASGRRTKLIAGDVFGMFVGKGGKADIALTKAWANKTGIKITGIVGDPRRGHLHQGIDLTYTDGGTMGADVYAIDAGKVKVDDKGETGAGKYVSVTHQNGMTSTYAHLGNIDVEENSIIAKGAKIGSVGSTGVSSGPHLHFQIKDKDGKRLDPIQVFVNNITLTFPIPAIKPTN